MEINYFSFVNAAWKRLESEPDLSPSHRALFWAIVHRWNINFRKEFEANRFDLMKMSGIKSEKTYFDLVKGLVEYGYINYIKGCNAKSKSTIEVAYVKFTEVDSTYVNSTYVEITEVEPSTYVKFTEVEPVYLGKNYLSLYKDTESSNTESSNTESNVLLENNNITLKEKKEKISEKKIRKKSERRPLETSFLESEIGTLEAIADYIKNESNFPHASPSWYFNGVKDWRDKATGLEPKRQNWKLVVNQFFRNDIARHGRVITENNGSFSNVSNKRSSNSQADPAELERTANKLLASRAAQSVSQAGFGSDRGHENDAIPNGKVHDF